MIIFYLGFIIEGIDNVGACLDFATYDDIPKLKRIWSEVFDEAKQVLDVFFDSLFIPANTVVYRIDDDVVSVAYMLECKQSCGHNGIYIYAVATLPEHRGNGYVSMILEHINEISNNRGYGFTILVPSEESLFKFYEKNGFNKTVCIKQVTFSKQQICSMADNANLNYIDKDDIFEIRNKHFTDIGSLIEFPTAHLQYAKYTIEYYGKKLLQFGHITGQGYMVCDKIGRDILIKEFVVPKDALGTAMVALTENYPLGENFIFRLPTYITIAGGDEVLIPYGMVCELIHGGFSENNPFLGMVLD